MTAPRGVRVDSVTFRWQVPLGVDPTPPGAVRMIVRVLAPGWADRFDARSACSWAMMSDSGDPGDRPVVALATQEIRPITSNDHEPSASRNRWGLRRRTAIAMAAVSAVVVLMLAVTTYVVVRSYLVGQREDVVKREAFANARVVSNLLPTGGVDPSTVLGSLRSEPGSIVLVRQDSEWLSSSIGVGPESLPSSILTSLDAGEVSVMRYSGDGGPRAVVAVPLPESGIDYVEVFPLSGLESTLDVLRLTLVSAALLMAGAGAALGAWATRRALAPLAATGRAAQRLADGELDARLETADDPDLQPFVIAFNEMADALTERIAHETRFASDVSHELRTPIATIRAATDVLMRRREELGERGREALDLLSSEVDEFDQLVSDLLEVSRLEATAPDPHEAIDRFDIADLSRRLAAQHCGGEISITVDPDGASSIVRAHRFAVERVLSNFLRNAMVHGGGCTGVVVTAGADRVCVAVDDDGPGVPPEDRSSVFDRFARGDDARARPGSGLGLAIASQYAARLGAELRVSDSLSGGGRFVLDLPRGEAP